MGNWLRLLWVGGIAMRPNVLALAILLAVTTVFLVRTPGIEGTERQVIMYCRFHADTTTAYGRIEGDRVRQIEGDLFGSRTPTDKTYALSEVRLMVPTQPSKVLALAGNYRSHLDPQTSRKNPELFFKVPSCLIPSEAPIVIPPGTEMVHPEGEMVVVIGKRASKVPVERAKEYVLGVTCGNDGSARRLVGAGGP